MDSFLSKNSTELSHQLSKFSNALPNHSKLLGFSEDEVDESINDAAFLAWLVKLKHLAKIHSKEINAFEKLVNNGDEGKTIELIIPSAIVYDKMPLSVAPGIINRFRAKAAKAKANKKCTRTVQIKLGIAPKTGTGAPTKNPPDLKVAEEAGNIKISFHKYGHIAVNLYRDKGDGMGYGKSPYKTLVKSPFIDKDIPTKGSTLTYKYKLVYMDDDNENGDFSAEISISLEGK